MESLTLYNPLMYDFSYPWYDDHMVAHMLTLKSMWTTTLPKDQALFMAKHLEDAIMEERGIQDNYELDRQKIHEEIVRTP